MKQYAVCFALALIMLQASEARSQSIPFPSRLELQFQNRMLAGVVLPDSHAVLMPRGSIGVSDRNALGAGARPLSRLSMTAYPLRFYGLEPYELSRMDCMVQGADMGLTMGMCLGAFGSMAGLWEDKNAWYIAGAMAALGALMGGTSWANNPRLRVRYRWEE
jgi:hypothetical protein